MVTDDDSGRNIGEQVGVMHRLPICFAATIALAVDRPSLTSRSRAHRPAPTMTAARTTVHRARRLVRNPLRDHWRHLPDLPVIWACRSVRR